MRCWYCKERILPGAVRCKHCGHDRPPRLPDVTARSRPYAAAIGVLGTVVSLVVFVVFILDLKLAWFAASLVLVPPVCAFACGRRALFPIRGLVPLAALTGLASTLAVSATTATMEKFSRMHSDASWSKLSEWAHM